MTCKEIFKDISTYQFNRSSIIDFVLNEHEDLKTVSYFRNLLFNLLEMNNSMDRLISFFYKLECGSTIYGSITIVENGKKMVVEPLSLLNEEIKKEKEIYRKFADGNTDDVKSILNYYEKLIIELNKLQCDFKYNNINEKCEDIDGLKYDIDINEKKIKDYREKLEKQKKNLNGNEPITVEVEHEIPKKNYRIITSYTYTHFRKYHYKKYEKVIFAKIKRLENEIDKYKNKRNGLLNEVKSICEECNASCIWDTLSDHYEFYNCEVSIHNLLENITDLKRYYETFLDELYLVSETIKSFSSLLDEFNDNLDLLSICSKIRGIFGENNLPMNSISSNVWQTDIRNEEVSSFAKTTKKEELKSVMNQMNEKFKKIMNMKPDFYFIKACADFHFDFLKVHPYLDGNGRTSRILLILMLASKDILIPSLYLSSEEKSDFYIRSNVALNGDYSVIENELLNRLTHFNPIIIPEEFEDEEKHDGNDNCRMKL